MLRPFILPELLCSLVVADPVCLHIIDQAAITGCLQDSGDVLVSSETVTVFKVCAIAVVGPQAMDCP